MQAHENLFTEINTPWDIDDYHPRLFAGEILVLRQIPEMIALCRTIQADICLATGQKKAWDCPNYTGLEKLLDYQNKFAKSNQYRLSFFAVLAAIGVDLDNTYYDHFPLRAVPPDTIKNPLQRAKVPPHRDTWGSSIYQQLNWWAPLSPAINNGIGFYPEYWNKHTDNTTAEWSFDQFLALRKNTPKDKAVNYPTGPRLTHALNTKAASIATQPGDIIVFSSAHLHASLDNNTDLLRLSIEMRTVDQRDRENQRAAINSDNQSTKPLLHWFKRISDKALLGQ